MDEPVSLVDVLPTLLDVVGLEPPVGIAGRSVVEPGLNPRAVFSQVSQSGRWQSVMAGRWKLIQGDESKLFDLHADPGEQTNLAKREVEHLDTLSEILAGHLRDPGQTPETREVSEEALERLRSLGYVQ